MALESSLRLIWTPGIVLGRGARELTTHRMFSTKAATVVRVAGGGLSFYVGRRQRSLDFMAHEADRFASAAFESLLVDAQFERNPRSTAWMLIKGYYAAFFAVHALLRISGSACTRIAAETATMINREVALLFPDSPKVSGGLYLLSLRNEGVEIECKKMDPGNGGSHESLWSLLPDFLDHIESQVIKFGATPEEDVRLISAISDFRKLIDKNGGALWFTRVRNRLNYSHEYGAWFPYIRSTSDCFRIKGRLNLWRGSCDEALGGSGDDELVQFASACAFLVSLCCTTIKDLSFRSAARSPFRSSSGLLASWHVGQD